MDASAFYSGLPFSSDSKAFSTPLIVSEISHRRMSKIAFQALKDLGRLEVREPKREVIQRVRIVAVGSGDASKVSEADLSIIALALELKMGGSDPLVISDDYSVENLANLLDIPVKPVATKGIGRVIHWIRYCPGCGKVFGKNVELCDVCGSKLRRKAR